MTRAWPALLVAAALAPASGAMGATARFEVPDDHGVLHSSTIAHTVFTLPPTFALAHGLLANTPAIGSYELVAPSGVAQCVLTLFGNANAQATRPTVRGGVFAARGLRFRIVRQGRAGTRDWFMGRANGEDVVAAFEPAPRGLAPARARWVFLQASLADRAGTSTPECAREVAKQRPTLRRAIASMHVVRTPLPRAHTSSAS